jgi:hypothetical protein
MKRKKTYYQRFMQMSDAEREAEVARFDEEFVRTKPLTGRQKAQHRRAGLKVGRPRVGRGAKRYSITLERGLAEKADALARKKKLSRSELIARGLQYLLKAS